MNRPTILIGGGYDKQSDFHEWIQSFDGKVRYLVLIGATKEQIQKEAAECGFHDCILKDTFEEALDTCVGACKTRRCSSAVTGMCKLGNVPEL